MSIEAPMPFFYHPVFLACHTTHSQFYQRNNVKGLSENVAIRIVLLCVYAMVGMTTSLVLGMSLHLSLITFAIHLAVSIAYNVSDDFYNFLDQHEIILDVFCVIKQIRGCMGIVVELNNFFVSNTFFVYSYVYTFLDCYGVDTYTMILHYLFGVKFTVPKNILTGAQIVCVVHLIVYTIILKAGIPIPPLVLSIVFAAVMSAEIILEKEKGVTLIGFATSFSANKPAEKSEPKQEEKESEKEKQVDEPAEEKKEK